jgi:hypothetical protein
MYQVQGTEVIAIDVGEIFLIPNSLLLDFLEE